MKANLPVRSFPWKKFYKDHPKNQSMLTIKYEENNRHKFKSLMFFCETNKRLMVTGEVKNKIDKIWEIFWTGGITNPLTVIEQFTYLLFIKGLNERQSELGADAELLGLEPEIIFNQELKLMLLNKKHLK